MTVELDAIEVLEIAAQIERNGAKFYRRAAEISNSPDVCKMFFRLADWETKHEQLFARMREKISDLDRGPKPVGADETLPDPKVMAGLAVFGIRPDPTDELSGGEGQADILRRAIEKEKDSIVFYSGLKDFVPLRVAEEKIDDIVREEMRHIRILNRLMKQREQPDCYENQTRRAGRNKNR